MNKRVIDADNFKVIETFKKENTTKVLQKYQTLGKWGDVSTDCDGDIILWEE